MTPALAGFAALGMQLMMLYIAYRQPFLSPPVTPERAAVVVREFVRWWPLVAGTVVGLLLLAGTHGWRGWPSVGAVGTYLACRVGGELGLLLRRRRERGQGA